MVQLSLAILLISATLSLQTQAQAQVAHQFGRRAPVAQPTPLSHRPRPNLNRAQLLKRQSNLLESIVSGITTTTTDQSSSSASSSSASIPPTTTSQSSPVSSPTTASTPSSTSRSTSSSASSSSSSASSSASSSRSVSQVIVTVTAIITNADGSTSTSTSLEPSDAPSNTKTPSNTGKTWGIVGGVVGGTALLAGILFAVWRCTQRRFSDLDDTGDDLKWPELKPEGQTVATNMSVLNPMGTRRTGGHGLEMEGDAKEEYYDYGDGRGTDRGSMYYSGENGFQGSYENISPYQQGGQPHQGYYYDSGVGGPSAAPQPPPPNVYPPSGNYSPPVPGNYSPYRYSRAASADDIAMAPIQPGSPGLGSPRSGSPRVMSPATVPGQSQAHTGISSPHRVMSPTGSDRM
ncbi:hypothetical protein T439DRAFT_324257 [Meredithblackwellia eburnea MCA 4105]